MHGPKVLRTLPRLARLRGTKTFMTAVKGWPQLDYLLQSDIRGCFDQIPHKELLSFLDEKMFEVNRSLVELIGSFLAS